MISFSQCTIHYWHSNGQWIRGTLRDGIAVICSAVVTNLLILFRGKANMAR
jgi:hypothetical protein